MDLREYLFKKNMTVTQFARKIDYGRTHINQVVLKRRRVSKKLARLIAKATEGFVQREDLIVPEIPIYKKRTNDEKESIVENN